MNLVSDPQSQLILGSMLALLSLASLVGWILKTRLSDPRHLEIIKNLNARIKAWWVMVITFFIAAMVGRLGSLVLFAFISFLAMREFITLTPTRKSDHRALFGHFL